MNRHNRHVTAHQGFAILTAMMVIVVVAVMVSSTVWRSWQMIEAQTYQQNRLKAAYVLSGLTAFAFTMLLDDGRKTGERIVSDMSPWATRIKETPLSTVLKAMNIKGFSSAEAKNATVSLAISDAQSRLNLSGLLAGAQNMNVNVLNAMRLFQSVHISKEKFDDVLRKLNIHVDADDSKIPLLPQTVADLTWLGLSQQNIAKISPYVVFLPGATQININTASPKVLYATVSGLTESAAQQIVNKRRIKPFTSLSEAAAAVRVPSISNNPLLSITSSYFLIHATVQYDGISLEQEALLQRKQLQMTIVWSRFLPVEHQKADVKDGTTHSN